MTIVSEDPLLVTPNELLQYPRSPQMDGELVLQRLNDFENGALGFLAGAIEAVATQPLTYEVRSKTMQRPMQPGLSDT